MNENSIFRLKVQYKTDNQETGEVEKIKLEILTQCVNYTDAEAVMNKVIEQYNMNKYEPCVYDIIKTKFEAGDIYGCKAMTADDDAKLTCGLLQHFFEDESDGLYAVETIVFGNKDNKEKDLKRTFYISASHVANAMGLATAILQYEGQNMDDCLIPSAKLDNAAYAYLRPKTSENIYKLAANIFV